MTGGCERGAPIACKSQKSKTAGSDNVEEVQVALCGWLYKRVRDKKAEPGPISGEALAGADKAGFKVRGLHYRVVCDVGRGLLTPLSPVRAQGAKGGAP